MYTLARQRREPECVILAHPPERSPGDSLGSLNVCVCECVGLWRERAVLMWTREESARQFQYWIARCPFWSREFIHVALLSPSRPARARAVHGTLINKLTTATTTTTTNQSVCALIPGHRHGHRLMVLDQHTHTRLCVVCFEHNWNLFSMIEWVCVCLLAGSLADCGVWRHFVATWNTGRVPQTSSVLIQVK